MCVSTKSPASEIFELTPAPRSSAGSGTGDAETANDAAAARPPTAATPPSAQVHATWRAWKVVIGCFCLTLPTYGLLSSIGLFQTYWHRHTLREHSESEIAWIISVFGFLDCLFAAPAGILFDRYGSAWLLPLGSLVYIASFAGLAFASTYAQFMGCMTVAGVFVCRPVPRLGSSPPV